MKVVGRRRIAGEVAGVAPEDAFRRAVVLQTQADLLNPFSRPRGFVHKARTWEEYAAWRRGQRNPRLW